ncbi:trifunctional serine/threonine-protein kinase/ATP-binding protein/sensor histidine kinase [Calothrix sp. NIES-2098]|uniref:trifunctional serine/threonine-protein kinase/ATP-binding protein/sensor histidine kinase n=1 Tax=Calothrix sp. NIES-2098 TaxID=1954171 RepID=UPI000B61EF06|nr:two-component hybrid sensor and regulator [Calothrix sp. NIES-2098]
MAEATVLPGYSITEQVYVGSKTLVYQAIREADCRSVIVKLLGHNYPSFSELIQFRNQYLIAKSLDFPGIVQPCSLENHRNGYALVMEDFGGISLFAYTQEQQHSALAIADFLAIALQLADILYELYRHRIIHKDIKPANILINPKTQQVKLIDFSIASLLPRETPEIQNPNVLEGTLAYLSPEQTGRMNRGIDYRSDFYSVGVTFYQLLTGKLPFQSNDAMELVYCHLAKQAIPVHEVNSAVPEMLSAIVAKLMAKNAEDRYQSALGLKHDLEICQRQWQETGTIEPFVLGQRDICDRFLIPEKLYGRETEVQELLAAFERVAQGDSEMMLVAGFSGIGKTVVVNEVHKPIVRQRGYFIKGKFDQFNRNIPFSAFVQAFRDLMGQLLTESDRQIQQWKTKILAALGENGQVITEVIPELERIIGKQPAAAELSGNAAQNRFNLLFQKFIQVFTTAAHPLVIFLDDLQWSDSASLKLMQLLISESKSGYLLLIGAYRDNEVSSAHPLTLTLDEIIKAGAKINTITLQALSQLKLNQLVAETLGCVEDLAWSLSQLVYQKTQGNPFFATQFLKALHQDGLIEFNFVEGCWQCDITKINQQALTDDVVQFMAFQLRRLPPSTQQVLKLAACIGNSFDLKTLAIVFEQSEIETASCLWNALQEGLILPQSDIYKFYLGEGDRTFNQESSEIVAYKFLHDRVQQAAYSLIPEENRAIAHYQIGQLLLQQISPTAREERIFELVNQLNYGTTLVVEQAERDNLAQLNLTASRKARAATAYQAAREYTTTGLTLLGEEAWQRQYTMTLALHELAAEIALLCGEFEQMNQWIAAVIDRAMTPLDRMQVYQVKIQALNSQNDFLAAIATGKSVLEILGVSLPDRPTPEDVQQAREEIAALIGDRSIEDLIHLPKMTDAHQLAIVQIAATIMPSCYLTSSPLYPLVVALQVKLSIQFGNSLFSPVSYVSYAFQINILWQEMTEVQQFGQLAYHLAKEPYAKTQRVATFVIFAGYIHHCTAHLRETLPIFQEGYQAGLETGNLEFVIYTVQVYSLNAFWTGLPLTELEPQIRAYHQHLRDLNQVTTAKHYLIYWETALILLGESEDEVPFRRDFYEKELLSQVQASNDMFRLCIFYLHRFTLNFLLEDITKAEQDAIQARKNLFACTGTIIEPVFYLLDSLTALARTPESNYESDIHWQRVQENQEKLQKWAHYAPMNHLHKLNLVEAEKSRVLNQKTAAIELYEMAIQGAKENEYLQDEALANELAAKFYLDWGKEKVAAGYMQEAYYCYSRWGAKAKVDDLEKRYPQLLQPILQQRRLNLNPLETIGFSGNSLSTRTSSTGNTSVSNALDFNSILKAAQAISSSIEFDESVANLTRIILENSGAKTSVLILPEDDTWQVRAITSINDLENSLEQIQTILNFQPLDTCGYIPTNIINYVKNTQQTILIDNLQTDIPGLIGEYMLEHQPKSVFCTPIINQGHLVGILYLENRLTSGVFTNQRLQVINLLASQTAISLENARLYQQAQQALQDLKQAQLQIVQSEKMSALGNLVSGVAHEMNNPLAFIAASLKQAKPTVVDIIEHLKLYQDFSNPSDKILEHGAEIDLEFSLEDLPKMIDAMVMACDRLKNISTSLRTFSRADKDYKVPFNIHEGIDSTILILKHRLKANEYRPAIDVLTEYGHLPQINCFPGQLNQVFMNILANAIDALEESNTGRSFTEIQANPNRITIKTSVEDKQVKISIADNGMGMSEEVKQKIFDHLFTTKAVGKGTGLGLAIAHQVIVDKHGGTLTVNSQPGTGAEFVIKLPI